jgi:hypothetical protein
LAPLGIDALTLRHVFGSLHSLPITTGRGIEWQLLGEQLDLLQDQMNQVADAVTKSDMDKLLARDRFLDERFGRSDLAIGPGGNEGNRSGD